MSPFNYHEFADMYMAVLTRNLIHLSPVKAALYSSDIWQLLQSPFISVNTPNNLPLSMFINFPFDLFDAMKAKLKIFKETMDLKQWGNIHI